MKTLDTGTVRAVMIRNVTAKMVYRPTPSGFGASGGGLGAKAGKPGLQPAACDAVTDMSTSELRALGLRPLG